MTRADFKELRQLGEQAITLLKQALEELAAMRQSDAQETLRAEFWALPPDGLVDRPTIAAVLYLSKKSLELFAIKGGGPKYMRLGRKSYYRKSDVLAWIKKHGQEIEATAQFKALKEGENDG